MKEEITEEQKKELQKRIDYEKSLHSKALNPLLTEIEMLSRILKNNVKE